MNHTVEHDEDDEKRQEPPLAQQPDPASSEHTIVGRQTAAAQKSAYPVFFERWNMQEPAMTALDALEQLHWSVFPLDQGKKPPLIGGTHPDGRPKRLSWGGCTQKPISRNVLLQWNKRYEPAAWAIITGKVSGVVVLDFDDNEGVQLLHQLGLSPHVRTPSGGYHVYFAHPGWHIKTLNGKTTRELGLRYPGLDIRADGGYAVFAGSNEQGQYLWLREPLPDAITLLPAVLRQLLGLLEVPVDAPRSSSSQSHSKVSPQQQTGRVAELLSRAVAKGASEGRNNAGFWLACRLRDMSVSEAEARQTMLNYAQQVPALNKKGQPEVYSTQEALASLSSAYQGNPSLRTPIAAHLKTKPGGAIAPLPAVDLNQVLDAYRKGEWGDALLFAYLFAGRCLYDHSESAWYVWREHYWKRDETGQIRQLISGQLASVYLKAAAELSACAEERTSDEEQGAQDRNNTVVKGLVGRASTLRTLARNRNVLTFATTDARLALTSSQWDTNPLLLGTKAGVLDLSTGQLRDGTPEDYIRTIIPTVWQGLQAQAPRFERFLHEIFGDREEKERAALITFLQRVLGYGITGKVSEHIFLLLYGEEGRNGKDTLMLVLHSVLGAIVGAVSNDVILSSGRIGTPGAAKPHLCSLQGKRIAWASETDRGARFDIGQVKFLTGGGAIAARQLYGREYTFEPSHLLLLLTNNRPHADAHDSAFWERICPVTFHMRFVDAPNGALERRRDRDLKNILQAEAGGILAWLIRGCLDWQQHGLNIPESVLRERTSYREEEDTLLHFFEACCVLLPDVNVKSSHLYERYRQWAEDNGIMKKLSGTSFGLEMKRRYQQQRTSQGIYYLGISLSASYPK